MNRASIITSAPASEATAIPPWTGMAVNVVAMG
jgi:hypothetical protein